VEILVYIPNSAPFFGGDSNHSTEPVSHDPSRKSFLAKLIGFIAVAGVAPRVVAKSAVSVTPADRPAPVSPFTVRPDDRAVPRRADTFRISAG
jgi:hypothetical protein